MPLLRLAAESDFPIPGDSGDPAEFSQGANSATFCVDQPWPWSPDAPLAERQAQWADAVHAAPDAPFAPFSADEVMFSIYGGADFCLGWPHTGARPPVEPGARYPRCRRLSSRANWTRSSGSCPRPPRCTPRRSSSRSPEPDTTRSAGAPAAASWRRVSSTRSRPATPRARRSLSSTTAASARFRSSPPSRCPPIQAAAIAPTARHSGVAHVGHTALDALKRSFLTSSSGGPGLRGGTFHTDYDFTWTTTLNGARWTDDVAVDGTQQWSFNRGALDADLQIDGPGGHDGTLHLEAAG